MEKALRYEFNKIVEIKDNIYPTNAPKGKKAPYLVYLSNRSPLKDLDGTKSNIDGEILLNILCESYFEMKDLSSKVERLLKTFPLRRIGDNRIYIDDLTIETISETYESELSLYRGIITFKLNYMEE
ncbi:hypothetical protein [Bacillus sp. JJ1474]|uniref:hypothetical protein n=1 Tax=Bacillus sp. JJ1474 TaxID=3122955 RepID=UPI003000010A